MYARVLNFTNANNIEDGVAFIREKALPVLTQLKGYGGLSASVDRPGGVLGILSLWETEADRDASFASLGTIRDEIVQVVGGQLTVETFEELLQEVGETPPTLGSALLIRRVSMDPAKVDENFGAFKSTVLPQIKSRAGFRAIRFLIDRQTGGGITATVWADAASMKAFNAESEGQALSDQRASRGVKFGDVSFREIVFSDFPMS